MTEILAVVPTGHEMVQLYLDGYQPGKKARSCYSSSALCGVGLGARFDTVPLADAVQWPGQWRWCKPCIGHAVAIAGLQLDVLTTVVDAITPCSCGGRRWVEDENWQPEFAEQTKREHGKGLIPCGLCNHGGWDVDEYEVDSR